MGPRSGVTGASKLRSGREWLRSRGPVTLAAALLLEVSSATAQNGTGARGLLRASLIVVLLLGVLIAAAIDSVLTSAARALVRAATSAERWTRVSVLGLPAPVDLSGAALLDRAGRPLRGGARNARIALLRREHAQQTYARSLRGRLDVALAELRRVARPFSRRIARAGLAVESRVLAARAALIARSISAPAWLRPRAARVVVIARAQAVRLWLAVRARTDPPASSALAAARPLGARLRHQAAQLVPALRDASRASAVGLARSRARLATIPVPAIPLPSMSLRTIRVVSGGVLLSFVFATVIGTTGLIADRGSVALGASTTLAIISGEVSVMDPGASEFRPGFDGDVLGAGSTIKTGPDTYAVLTYFEGSTVSIDPDTVLVIEALHANPDGSTVIGMRQDVGRTWHAVTKLLTAGSKYEVRTPTATATVRGTLFLVGVRPSGDLGLPETLIETTEGAVAAEREPTAEEPAGEEIIVPAGFQVKATEAARIPLPIPAPEPERKVTVTVGTTNSVVVDPQGRSNGEVNGRIVVQTPGATVEKIDGKIVVTLPNTTDGKISTVIQPVTPPDDEEAPPPPPVQVTTVVQERGKGESRNEETVQLTTQPAVTGVEIKKGTDGAAPPELRKLDETEKKDAPKVKVAEVPDKEVVALARREERRSNERDEDGDEGRNDGDGEDGERKDEKPRGIANAIVTLTLPPLSADEIARREEQRRENEERERRENATSEEGRREDEQKKIDELRRREAQAVADAARLGGERLQEEGRRDVRRETAERRGEEDRREEARQGNEPAPPVALFQQVVRAIAPADSNTRRDEDKRIDDLRKAEAEAQKAAEKVAGERRKAEQRLREDSIKAEEQKRKDAEKRAEELRKAEEKAKEQAAKQAEEMRKIEEKAREQAAKLEAEPRKQAEQLLEEFRKAEEKARERAAKELEEQRKAEENAREDAERRLRELRREEERAQERERDRQRERERDDDRRRGGFVPRVELNQAPGVGTRSAEDDERSEQLREKQEKAAERGKGDS